MTEKAVVLVSGGLDSTTVLAMATGLENTLGSTGRADRAIVVRDGALTES